jgi:hypothetical protein
MNFFTRSGRLAACLLVFFGLFGCRPGEGNDGGEDSGFDADGGAKDSGSPPDAGPSQFTPGPRGCQPIELEADVDLGGYHCDRYEWTDETCAPRTAALVRNNAPDPGGSRGGFLRELTWRSGTRDITARGTGMNGWNGWGYVVNHYGNSAALSRTRTGTFRTVLAGKHHALHEYKLQMSPGGTVDVTVQWFFRTGASHPIYAITFDATPAGENVVNADTRAPYGELAFEGTLGPIGGIGWGDKYRFTTTGQGPLTTATAWEYTASNIVPHVRMWAQTADAEMGAVQTQSFDQHVAGGDYGGGQLAANCWEKTSSTKGPSCSPSGQSMPQDWLWPFQLNQYELPFTNASHRLAWGAQFGAIGKSSVSAFGKTFSGYPQVSYSVFGVVGQKSNQATLKQMEQVERMLATEVTASEGTVATSGPAGVGRTDTATFSPAGYNPSYASWDVLVASNRATVTVEPTKGALAQPLLRFTGFTISALSKVTVDGRVLTADEEYFATVDTASQTVWLTLNGVVSGRTVVHLE